jgi:ABC-2 type transport system ATP-binding protein
VSALLDWLATQPEQQLDGAGDPRAGHDGRAPTRAGSSSSPRHRPRIDAIAPASPGTRCSRALPRRLVKGGWAAALAAWASPPRPRSASSAPRACRPAPSTRTSPPR